MKLKLLNWDEVRLVDNYIPTLVQRHFIGFDDSLTPPRWWEIQYIVPNETKNLVKVMKLARQILRNKYFVPIVVAKDGWIIDGHHRYEAAKMLGAKVVPVQLAYSKYVRPARENPRLDVLSGLAAEAIKAGSWKNFLRDFSRDIKHGLYWHVTKDRFFEIDPSKGPTDASSMSDGGVGVGDLMFTSDLEHWVLYYGASRPYAAMIDVSSVPGSAYRQVGRGFGNEFYLNNAAEAGARVVRVVTTKTARRIDKKYSESLPQSEHELRRFYTHVTGRKT